MFKLNADTLDSRLCFYNRCDPRSDVFEFQLSSGTCYVAGLSSTEQI